MYAGKPSSSKTSEESFRAESPLQPGTLVQPTSSTQVLDSVVGQAMTARKSNTPTPELTPTISSPESKMRASSSAAQMQMRRPRSTPRALPASGSVHRKNPNFMTSNAEQTVSFASNDSREINTPQASEQERRVMINPEPGAQNTSEDAGSNRSQGEGAGASVSGTPPSFDRGMTASTTAVATSSVGDVASMAHANTDDSDGDDDGHKRTKRANDTNHVKTEKCRASTGGLDDDDSADVRTLGSIGFNECDRKVARTAALAARQHMRSNGRPAAAAAAAGGGSSCSSSSKSSNGSISGLSYSDHSASANYMYDDGEGSGSAQDVNDSHSRAFLLHHPHTIGLVEACKLGPAEVQRVLFTKLELHEDVVQAVLEIILSWPEEAVQDEVVRVLLRDPRAGLSANNWWILRHAARFGRARFVRLALQSLNLSPFEKWAIVTSNVRGLCTLTWACVNDNVNVIDAILDEAAATPTTKINEDLAAAIAVSRQLGNCAIVDRLVNYVSQPGHRDFGGHAQRPSPAPLPPSPAPLPPASSQQ